MKAIITVAYCKIVLQAIICTITIVSTSITKMSVAIMLKLVHWP